MYNYLDEQGVAKLSELINSDIEAVDSRVEDVENALTTAEISTSVYTEIRDLKSGVPFNYISVKGKNIIYQFTETVEESAGIIPTYDNDNITVTLNGTPTGTAFINLFNGLRVSYWNDKTRSRLKPGVYTISSSTFDNNMFWAVEKRSQNGNQFSGYYAIGVASPGANYLTFTITEEDFNSYYPVFQLCVNPGESYSNFIVYPQIEEGSVATEHATSFIKSPVMFTLGLDFVYAEPTSDPFVITQQCTQQEGYNWINIFNAPSMPIVTVNYNTYKTPLSAVYTKINGVDSRVSAVESSVSGIASEISDLTSRVSYNEIAIQTNIENIAAVDTRVDNAESEIAANTGDINSLGGRVTTSEGDITSLDNRVTALEQGGGGGAEKLKYKSLPLIKYSDAVLDSYSSYNNLATTKNFIFIYNQNYNYDSEVRYAPKYSSVNDFSSVEGSGVSTRVEYAVSPYCKLTAVDDYTISLSYTSHFYREENGVIVRKNKNTNDNLYNLNYYFYTDGASSFCSKEVSTIVWRKFSDLITSLPTDTRAIKKGFAYSDSTDTSVFLYSTSARKIYEILNFSSANMLMYTYDRPSSLDNYSTYVVGIDGNLYTNKGVFSFNRESETCTSIYSGSHSLDYRYGFFTNPYAGVIFRIENGKKKLFRSTTIPLSIFATSYDSDDVPQVDFTNLSFVYGGSIYKPVGTSTIYPKYQYYLSYMEDPDYE